MMFGLSDIYPMLQLITWKNKEDQIWSADGLLKIFLEAEHTLFNVIRDVGSVSYWRKERSFIKNRLGDSNSYLILHALKMKRFEFYIICRCQLSTKQLPYFSPKSTVGTSLNLCLSLNLHVNLRKCTQYCIKHLKTQ